MLDSDLAMLYQVETKVFNQAVKRNINRFPDSFMFQLTGAEFENLRSQIVTSSVLSDYGGRRYRPYVFTEQGVAMLSAVLRSDVAVEMSIEIIDAFVHMRRFLEGNQELFARISRVELKQLESDQKFTRIFRSLAKKEEMEHKLFFNGHIYDAFALLVKIIKKANQEIILIDNYVDVDTLNILCKRKNGVTINLYTSKNAKLSQRDIGKFNAQYKYLSVHRIHTFHDRFLIIDHCLCYHIGASLKDAGKKSFAISQVKDRKIIKELLQRVKS